MAFDRKNVLSWIVTSGVNIKFMDKKTIKKIAQKHGVRCHHYDQFEFTERNPRYEEDHELSKAVVVIYSTSHGHWTLAINNDGTVMKPGDQTRKTSEGMGRIIDRALQGK